MENTSSKRSRDQFLKRAAQELSEKLSRGFLVVRDKDSFRWENFLIRGYIAEKAERDPKEAAQNHVGQCRATQRRHRP